MIFQYNRRIPNALRNVCMAAYADVVSLRNRIRYNTPDLFHTVNIETSSHCNRTCRTCPNAMHPRPPGILEMDVLRNVARQLMHIGFRGEVAFTGYNEPLLDDRIGSILRLFRRTLPNNPLSVYSNGDFLTPDVLRACVQARVHLNLTLHDGITDAWKARLKQMARTEARWVRMRTNMQAGVLSTRGGLVHVPRRHVLRTCILPATELTLDYGGNYVLCSDDFHGSVSWGNAANNEIMDVWNRSDYAEARRALRSGKAAFAICKHCFCRGSTGGKPNAKPPI